jgi:hypothetical protein
MGHAPPPPLVRLKNWERYGLKSRIEAAKKRLHHNVLAIALANKRRRPGVRCQIWADMAMRDRDAKCQKLPSSMRTFASPITGGPKTKAS